MTTEDLYYTTEDLYYTPDEDTLVLAPALAVGGFVDRGVNDNLPALGEVTTVELLVYVGDDTAPAILPLIFPNELADLLGIHPTAAPEEDSE
jgi:hypothetical protein